MQYVSPYAALEKHASGQPGSDAIVVDDTRLSHSEIFERISRCAGWLTLNGIIPGDVTGIVFGMRSTISFVRWLSCAWARRK